MRFAYESVKFNLWQPVSCPHDVFRSPRTPPTGIGSRHAFLGKSFDLSVAVATASRDGLHRELGACTVRDGCAGLGVHVDVTYDAVNVALEVTSLVDEDHLDATATVRKLAQRLTRVAVEEGLGGWFLAATVSPNFKALEGDRGLQQQSGASDR